MRSSNAWTTKSWQRSEWRLGFNSVHSVYYFHILQNDPDRWASWDHAETRGHFTSDWGTITSRKFSFQIGGNEKFRQIVTRLRKLEGWTWAARWPTTRRELPRWFIARGRKHDTCFKLSVHLLLTQIFSLGSHSLGNIQGCCELTDKDPYPQEFLQKR